MSSPVKPTLRYRFVMRAYQAALTLLEPLVWRYFRKRGQGDAAYLERWDERRGQGQAFAADIWIHVVSLGEFRSAEPIVAGLLERGHRLLLTHATPAGRHASEAALADEIASGLVSVRYAPIDRTRYWRNFFASHRPKLGLVFEMEFWPGMIEAAASADVPLWLVNSQVPGKSLARARRVASLLGQHPVSRAARVLAKSDRMADRFRRLGALEVEVMGETRFDIPQPADHVAAGEVLRAQSNGRAVYTFASVVAGEEETYLAAAKAMPDALIIWVPRAPELFDATYRRLAKSGFSITRRSEAFDEALAPTADLSTTNVLLGDSFGEMFFYMAAADAVSVGGGFVEKGAHNVIEPLALGKPVVTGPHIWTIEFPGHEARDAGVLTVCETAPELAIHLEQARRSSSEAATAFHATYAGASQRLIDTITQHFEARS